MKRFFIEFFGWYGVVAILGAYALVSYSILGSNSFWYQFLNASGGIGLVAVSLYKKDWQLGVLNILWALVALVALYSILK